MTFDARGGTSKSAKNNLVFGGIAVGIVSVAFAGTFLLGSGSSSQSASAAATPTVAQAKVSAPTSTVFKSNEAKAYMAALAAIDPDGYASITRKLNKNAGKSSTVRFEIVTKHAAKVIKANSTHLQHADARHMDRLLSHTRTSLKKASRSNSKWCKGATYAGLQNAKPSEIKALQKEMMAQEEAIQTYTFEVLTLLMEAAADARDNPRKHGRITPADEMAVQGVVMSMMSDPQIMPLILATQSGQAPEDLMVKLDMCELASTFVSAAKTLPQDTKGRVWAEIVRETELGGADMGRLSGLAGY